MHGGIGWGAFSPNRRVRDSSTMNGILPIGLASGLAAALLFLVVRTGSMFALVLDILAPLPILIAALGWGPRAALIGTAVGTLTISAIVAGLAGLVFGLGIGLPAWLMGILLLSHRKQDGFILFLPVGISLLPCADIRDRLTPRMFG